MQLQAAVFIIHCKITLHVSGALCTHHQEYIKTVDAITGTSHALHADTLSKFMTNTYTDFIF